MGSYTWKITDPSLLQQIKSAKPGNEFKSDKFSLFGFKWYLELNPNGINHSRKGNVSIFLYLMASSPKIHSLTFKRKCTLIEDGSSYSGSYEITNNDNYCAL